MFVPYEPYLAFDVYRHKDRCVCGCSAVVVSREGTDKGYCLDCAKVREEFVQKMVGSIQLPQSSDSTLQMLKVIEEIRKSYFAERIYYLVDDFFAKREDGDKSLPYNNDSFIARVYREKFSMIETFMPNLPKINITPLFARIRYYSYYYSELEKMLDRDWVELCKIDAKLGNYPYKEEPRCKNIRY